VTHHSCEATDDATDCRACRSVAEYVAAGLFNTERDEAGALEVESEQKWEALTLAHVIDQAHKAALFEARERELEDAERNLAARRKRDALLAGGVAFVAFLYILRAVLWWWLGQR